MLTRSFWTTDIWPVLPQSKEKKDKGGQVDTKLAVWNRCFGISYSSTYEFTGRTQTEVQLPIISLVLFLSWLDKTLHADLFKILSVKNYHPLPKFRSVSYETLPSQMIWGCILEGIVRQQDFSKEGQTLQFSLAISKHLDATEMTVSTKKYSVLWNQPALYLFTND